MFFVSAHNHLIILMLFSHLYWPAKEIPLSKTLLAATKILFRNTLYFYLRDHIIWFNVSIFILFKKRCAKDQMLSLRALRFELESHLADELSPQFAFVNGELHLWDTISFGVVQLLVAFRFIETSVKNLCQWCLH